MSLPFLLGPVFQLRWMGTLCPCIEKAEDTKARKSLVQLSNLRVKWHRSAKDNSSSGGGGVGSMLGSFFGAGGGKGNSNNSSSDSVEARLCIVDSPKGPEIQVSPHQQGTDEAGEISMKQSGGYMKTVPLKNVDSAVSETSWSSVANTDKSSAIVLQSETDGFLLRINILDEETGIVITSDNQIKEMIECFTSLIEWDGRRRAANPEEQEEEAIEERTLKQRAQKAAHFAKREIELQTKKRETEKRKAKYIKDSGGLKYTALAMAKNAERA